MTQSRSSASVMIRFAGADDRPVVEDALVWALNWSPEREPLEREQALSRPDIAHYVIGWPAPGDLGVVADAEESVGAAWLRYFPAHDPAYGFVAPDVPELGIGVHPEYRGRGIGRRLLRALLTAARDRDIERISLSVERANRAHQLYLEEGFRVVVGDDNADTMVLNLSPSHTADHRRPG